MIDKAEYVKSIYPEFEPYTLFCRYCGTKLVIKSGLELLRYDDFSGEPFYRIVTEFKCPKFGFWHDKRKFESATGKISNWHEIRYCNFI